MMNENIAKGKWNEVKGKLQRAWGDLTGDELEATKGDFNSISGLLQKKYGLAQEDARSKLNQLIGGENDKEIPPREQRH